MFPGSKRLFCHSSLFQYQPQRGFGELFSSRIDSISRNGRWANDDGPFLRFHRYKADLFEQMGPIQSSRKRKRKRKQTSITTIMLWFGVTMPGLDTFCRLSSATTRLQTTTRFTIRERQICLGAPGRLLVLGLVSHS